MRRQGLNFYSFIHSDQINNEAHDPYLFRTNFLINTANITFLQPLTKPPELLLPMLQFQYKKISITDIEHK